MSARVSKNGENGTAADPFLSGHAVMAEVRWDAGHQTVERVSDLDVGEDAPVPARADVDTGRWEQDDTDPLTWHLAPGYDITVSVRPGLSSLLSLEEGTLATSVTAEDADALARIIRSSEQ